MERRNFSMDEVVSYCNQYGFIFQGSEIYGGLANTWDYGPLGTRLKNQVKDAWRYYFIQIRENSYEVDADILMIGLPSEKLRFHDHDKLAHYAKEACDIEYQFPFGWGEINGTHNRTNFDLTRHQEYSGKSMEYELYTFLAEKSLL